MSRIANNGTCFICQQTFSKTAIFKHVILCLNKKMETAPADTALKKTDSVFMLEVSAYKVFWLILEMRGKATLAQLDNFLRQMWLECCGHLSQFSIGQNRYISHPEDEPGMDIQIKKVLHEGTTFEYVYDFGSSTHLTGRVLQVREGAIMKPLQLLAQNNMPEAKCEDCATDATLICVWCHSLFCKKDAKKHVCEEGEEGNFSPLVNSPRAGECGYTGPDSDLKKYRIT